MAVDGDAFDAQNAINGPVIALRFHEQFVAECDVDRGDQPILPR